MTTSGTSNYTETRNQVIYDAFQLLTIYGVGETVSAEDLSFANRILNKMIKAWQAKGLHLWTKTEAVLYLNQYQERYSLGGTARSANLSDALTTRLTANMSAAETELLVESTAGMIVGKPIGIVLNTRALFWTTIVSVDSATQVTVAQGLPSISSAEMLVYSYNESINKPLRIHEYARIVSGFDAGLTSTEVQIPVSVIAYMDYMALPVKTTNSQNPIQIMYNPYVNDGNLWMFPRPNDCSYRMYFTYERKLEDMTSASETFDFPDEWLEALTYQLALRLARPFGRAAALNDIAPMASVMLEDLLSWDSEKDYVEINPCNWE